MNMALVLRKAVLPKNISLLKWVKGRPLATAAKRTDATAICKLPGVFFYVFSVLELICYNHKSFVIMDYRFCGFRNRVRAR